MSEEDPLTWKELTWEEEKAAFEPDFPPLPAANPAWLTPLCNAYTEKAIYLWHKLVYDGTSDLDHEECGTAEIGGIPTWWAKEGDHSLDTIFSPQWTHTTHGGHEFRDQWLRWGLENGIAPGQPFLVRIGKPHYSTDYYGEVDCEWDVEVVRVMPSTPARALRSLARVMKRIEAYFELFLRRKNRLRDLQDTDASALSLKTEPYFTEYYYDDMAMPNGLRVILCSAHHSMWGNSKRGGERWPAHLVSGEDKEADFGRAFRDLLKNIKRYRPGIDLTKVIELARERAGLTRWEHLGFNINDEPVY